MLGADCSTSRTVAFPFSFDCRRIRRQLEQRFMDGRSIQGFSIPFAITSFKLSAGSSSVRTIKREIFINSRIKMPLRYSTKTAKPILHELQRHPGHCCIIRDAWRQFKNEKWTECHSNYNKPAVPSSLFIKLCCHCNKKKEKARANKNAFISPRRKRLFVLLLQSFFLANIFCDDDECHRSNYRTEKKQMDQLMRI